MVNGGSMKALEVSFLLIALTGNAYGWLGSATHSCVNMYRRSSRAATKGHSVLINTEPKRNTAFSPIADSIQSPSPRNMAQKPSVGPLDENFMFFGRDMLSRRSAFFLSLPLIFGAAASASADVQLTYGSGSFSGSSVVNGVLSAYGLPQLPDTKGFTPFLSQYQVRRFVFVVFLDIEQCMTVHSY
jgi:hypothetical protein